MIDIFNDVMLHKGCVMLRMSTQVCHTIMQMMEISYSFYCQACSLDINVNMIKRRWSGKKDMLLIQAY